MSHTKTIRIICFKEHEKIMLNTIYHYNFSILERYDRRMITFVIQLPKHGSSVQENVLLDLQDELLGL